ncbi:MAG TPA: response regulator, partial [Myxococcota bacterium]|nr:response regulator [Myxococcota bacterium]
LHHPSPRVLVIDDEEKVCTALRRSLRDQGDTTTISSPKLALLHLQEGARYDLVFCDLRMPGMSGAELYRELLRVAPEQAARVVFMTADADRREHSEFLSRGGNVFIEKPFDIQRVRELAIGSSPYVAS